MKFSRRYRLEVTDGTKVYEKQIYKQPEKYFTQFVMEQLEEAVGREFKYGKLEVIDESIDDTA